MTVKDYAEIIKLAGADAIGTYTDDFYKDMPAITCKKYGSGKAYYQAARIINEDMGKLTGQNVDGNVTILSKRYIVLMK